MSYARRVIGTRSLLGVTLVLLIHLAMLNVLREGLAHSWSSIQSGPLMAVLIDEPRVEPAVPPPPPPTFRSLQIDAVPEPVITIDLPSDTNGSITLPVGAAPQPKVISSAAEEVIPPNIDHARSEITPEYPPKSKRLGEQGRVLLLVHVLKNGRPGEIKVNRSSGFARLDDAAVQHVQRAWRFIPARQGDEAVAAWGQFAVTFRIRKVP